MGRAAALLATARELASANPDFQAVLGPGIGNRATNAFLRQLQERARATFGADYSERKICGKTSLAVDFFFPEEATIVEVALGLPNPGTEFEKDILKAIVAQDHGHHVRGLLFISRPGVARKCSQPGIAAVRQWVQEKHGLTVEVHELTGQPRPRGRRRR